MVITITPKEPTLRAAFGLALFDVKGWDEIFHRSFEIARYNDHTVLHDFGAMAIHLFTIKRQTAEAQRIADELNRYLDRADLAEYELSLYPEAIPLVYAYSIPNKKLKHALR